MEKLTLISELKKVIDSASLSVDLYFVFKIGDFYIQYLADPDQKLREELINEFKSVLEIFTAEKNSYELNNIYDDNEYEDYHLFFDNINNNQIAKSIFNFDRFREFAQGLFIQDIDLINLFLLRYC